MVCRAAMKDSQDSLQDGVQDSNKRWCDRVGYRVFENVYLTLFRVDFAGSE